MPYENYFHWSADRVALDLGSIPLPFETTLWGLVLAVIVFFYYGNRLAEKEEPAWKFWALGIGALVGGQLLFLLLPSPSFEQIGPIRLRWYSLLFAGSFLAGYVIMRRMYLAGGRTVEELDKILLYVMVGTIIGARLGHVIFYDLEMYLRRPAEILAVWKGGLASHGAAIGILVAMYLYVKKVKNMSLLWLADRVVIVVALGGAFIRTGNFFNSEIVGQPTELPWGIVFEKAISLAPAERMVPRHPTMLYEALLCLVVFGILWWIYKRYRQRPPEGSVFGVFLVLLFGGRFFLEFTKIHQAEFATGWTINMGQWLSIPLVAAGIWLLWKKVNWSKSEAAEEKTLSAGESSNAG